MDRELHRAHDQSEHRNGTCEDPMTLIWDDTNQQRTHVVEFFVQLCTQHWTALRSKRHADAWAETDSPNGRHLKAYNRSGAEIQTLRLGDFTQTLVPYAAQHSDPSIDASLGPRTRKENRGRWKSGPSVLQYEQRARLHKSFHRLTPSPEVAFCGFSVAEGCCSQGLSHQAQYNLTVLLVACLLDFSARSPG